MTMTNQPGTIFGRTKKGGSHFVETLMHTYAYKNPESVFIRLRKLTQDMGSLADGGPILLLEQSQKQTKLPSTGNPGILVLYIPS